VTVTYKDQIKTKDHDVSPSKPAKVGKEESWSLMDEKPTINDPNRPSEFCIQVPGEIGADLGILFWARSIVIFSIAILTLDVPCPGIQFILQQTHIRLVLGGFRLTSALVAPIHTCKESFTVADSVQDVDGMSSFLLTSLDSSLTAWTKVGEENMNNFSRGGTWGCLIHQRNTETLRS
jgi:hypothetical protein